MAKIMRTRPLTLIVLALISLIALDQVIKFAVERHMFYGETINLLPFLSLHRTHNTGVAFSLLSSFHGGALIIFTAIILMFILYLWWKTPYNHIWAQIGFTLIAAGAVGNLIDRIYLGYVVDYILFHLPQWSFAVFNLADSFITIGAIMIIVQELVQWKKSRPV